MSSFEGRRKALARFVAIGAGALGSTLASLVALVATPRANRSASRWRAVGAMSDLPPDGPMSAVIAERQADGWYQTRKQSVVFIDRDATGLRAMSATCRHLGCRVRWDDATSQYHCPCHGGVYSRAGEVVSGPPPEPLRRLPVRLNEQTSQIEVEL